MGIDVKDKKAQSAVYTIVTNDRGKLRLEDEAGNQRGAVGIGGTNAVGPKTVETKKGGFITELRDAVGGTFSAEDAVELFSRLVFSDGRGDVEGINGVTLVSLTEDSFTVEIDNGRAVDTLTIQGFDAALAELDSGADAGDQASRFSIIDDDTPTIIGTSNTLGDLVGGTARGQADQEALLRAALDQGDERVSLLGLEEDNFAVQISVGSKTDTILFQSSDTAAAIAAVESGVVNPGNPDSQFVILDETDSGTVGIGGGRLNVTDTEDGSDDIGGVLSVADAILLAQTADERPNVEAIDQGDTVRVVFPGNEGSTEFLIVPEDLF